MFRKKPVSVKFLKILLLAIWGLFIVFWVTIILMVRWYNTNIMRPLDTQQMDGRTFNVAKGSSWDDVADQLYEEDLIKNARALKWYVRFNDVDNVHAGSFELNPAMSAREIVEVLTSAVEADVKITIYPEQNLKEIGESLVEQGFSLHDSQAALDIQNYRDHYLVKEVIPKGEYASLEGYIMPETFYVNQFNAESAQEVIKQSLDLFVENLTPQMKDNLKKSFDSLHEAVIMASIVELEADPVYRAQVAQVFLKRFAIGERLGSDVTFIYIAELENRRPDVKDPSPYNTRLHHGLPPGPISNVTRDSLLAVANPSKTDYLFFLVGDDEQMYFNHTYEEHQADIQKYCQVKCRSPRSS